MFNGAHVAICSKAAESGRKFFRDVLHLSDVGVGGGWLIFALPPAEAAFRPHESSRVHELHLMYDDIEARKKRLADQRGACEVGSDEGWGLLSSFRPPGGGGVGFYQPRHEGPSRQ